MYKRQVETGTENTTDISTMTLKEAKELSAEDGYWGLEQTSERIVNLALGFAGYDTGKLGTVREGIFKGFEMAKTAFGRDLPEISQKTIEMSLKKLGDWEKDPVKPLPGRVGILPAF